MPKFPSGILANGSIYMTFNPVCRRHAFGIKANKSRRDDIIIEKDKRHK